MALPKLRGIRALVVDDNIDCREILSSVLSSQGARVTLTTCGTEAIAALYGRIPDIVVTDISMPWSDGFQVLSAVREILGHEVPCLAMSAYGVVVDETMGFDEFLAKPLDLLAVVDTVERLVAQHAARSTTMSGVRPVPSRTKRRRASF